MVPTKFTTKTYLLKCDAVKFGTQAPTYRRKMLSPSWHHLQNLSYSEGHSTLIRNVGALLPNFTVFQHTKINFIVRNDQSVMRLDILGCSEVFVTRAWPNSSTLPVKESKSSSILVTKQCKCLDSSVTPTTRLFLPKLFTARSPWSSKWLDEFWYESWALILIQNSEL